MFTLQTVSMADNDDIMNAVAVRDAINLKMVNYVRTEMLKELKNGYRTVDPETKQVKYTTMSVGINRSDQPLYAELLQEFEAKGFTVQLFHSCGACSWGKTQMTDKCSDNTRIQLVF